MQIAYHMPNRPVHEALLGDKIILLMAITANKEGKGLMPQERVVNVSLKGLHAA